MIMSTLRKVYILFIFSACILSMYFMVRNGTVSIYTNSPPISDTVLWAVVVVVVFVILVVGDHLSGCRFCSWIFQPLWNGVIRVWQNLGRSQFSNEIRKCEDELRKKDDVILDLRQQLEQATREKEDAMIRLSELMGSRLRENNPNIVDLNDNFRPTKLAEISSELYDNEWTNAYSVLEGAGASETEGIRVLLDIVMVTYQLCQEWSKQEWEKINNWLGDREDNTARLIRQTFKDERKATAGNHLQTLQQTAVQTLGPKARDKKLQSLFSRAGPVRKYLDACVSLCLRMVVQDPLVVWYCPGWRSVWFQMDNTSQLVNYVDPTFETKLFRPYLRSGKFVEYIVWPALLLHDNGPLLGKGVAQGSNVASR